MSLKTKTKDINGVRDYLKHKEAERRVKQYQTEEYKHNATTDKEIIGCRDVILKSRKLLRLFTEEQQIHQLTIKLNNAYRGRNVFGGYTWGVIHELIKLGLIQVSRSVTYKRENTTLKYYILTPEGWDIAHPLIYPPNPKVEQKVESVLHRLLNEAQLS